MSQKHSHYHKDVSHLKSIDIYRLLELFDVTDQAIGHAVKKLMCAGKRGSKSFEQDVREAVDTLNRRLQMIAEDDAAKLQQVPPGPAVIPNVPVAHVGGFKPTLPEGWTDIHVPRAPWAVGTQLELLMVNGRIRGPVSYEPGMLFPDVAAWRFGVPLVPKRLCIRAGCSNEREVGNFCKVCSPI